MKLMHIADLHLDSPFSGFSRDAADKRRADLRDCFVRAMRTAGEVGASLVLIPGDLFDAPFCTSSTRKIVFDAIRDFARPVIIAPGNHDYYTKSGTYADPTLPENAYVFKSGELGRFDFDELGISVIGYAFTSDRYESDPLSGEIPTSEQNVNILCAHTELGVPFSKYAPTSTSAIAHAGFTYAALGHVHMPKPPINSGSSLIAYSGFAQGRSFDELGEGGAYIIDIDLASKEVSYERIKLSTLSYEIEELDVTGAECDGDVIRDICEFVERRGYGSDTALRVKLAGSVSSTYDVRCETISSSDELSGRLALLQIRNEICAAHDLRYLADDLSVRGEVYRTLLPMLESENAEERARASLALKFALAALDRRELGIE